MDSQEWNVSSKIDLREITKVFDGKNQSLEEAQKFAKTSEQSNILCLNLRSDLEADCLNRFHFLYFFRQKHFLDH